MADGSMPIRTERNKGGQPSGYSVDIAADICEQVAIGRTIRDIASDANMPGPTAIYKWLGEHKEFANMYARAREERADVIAYEILTIADDETAPDDRRVKIDARKWFAAKLAPKNYGDKLAVGGDSENPIKHEMTITSEIMSTLNGNRPLPAAAQSNHRASSDDDSGPEVAIEQPVPH